MKIFFLKQRLATALFIGSLFYGGHTTAHSVGNTIDATGTNASATDLYQITCSGGTDYLIFQIEDRSAPVPGLLMSVQAYFDQRKIMTNTSDSVSGDGKAGSGAQLWGGDGNYYLSASKTAAGTRQYNITVHCMSKTDHTPEDVGILQQQ